MTEISEKEFEGKTWGDVVRQYKPDATDEEVEYILWNETCYPFDTETALKQIHAFFNQNKQQ